MNLRILSLITALFMGGAVSLADLPDPIREMSDYFRYSKSFHVGVILTNYKPTALFRNNQDARRAAKLFGASNGADSEISYFEYATSGQGMVYKEIFIDPSQAHFPLTSALSTSPHTLFLGRSSDVWWYATAYPKTPGNTVLAINALVDSKDGVQVLSKGQRNPYFRTLVVNEGSLFSHLKLGPFSPNTFRVHSTEILGKYAWTATNHSGVLKGTVQLSSDGEFVLRRDAVAGNAEISVRMRWNSEDQLPDDFFIVNPTHSNEIYQSYTRVDAPVGLWKPHPDCFHFSYHTNSQDLVTLHGIDGEIAAVNYIQTPRGHREGPDSFQKPRFVFVFSVVLSGLLLVWIARRKVVSESMRASMKEE